MFWACKRAAEEAQQAVKAQLQRLKPSKPPKLQASRLEETNLVEELLSSVDMEQELRNQEERDRVLAYASADWRVQQLPKFQSCGPFLWPSKRKQGRPLTHLVLPNMSCCTA